VISRRRAWLAMHAADLTVVREKLAVFLVATRT
jgi:hypothetical protein